MRVRRSRTSCTLGTPKNRERRDVDLISDVVAELARLQGELGNPNGDSLVFPSANRVGFLTPSVVLRRYLYPAWLAPTFLASGRRRRKERSTVSGTRSPSARWRAALRLRWLSRHLGHSTLKVTTDVYGHWERAERKLQAAKLEGAFPV